MGGQAPPPDGDRARLSDEFFDAIRNGREEAALDVVRRSIGTGLSGQDIYLGVFQPALDRIGEQWEQGQCSVGEEHRATAISRWLMDVLLYEFEPAAIRRGCRDILAGCVQGERHDLGLMMVVRFLRQDGWPVVDLDADVPHHDFVQMAVRLQPSACLLSAGIDQAFPEVKAAITGLRGAGVQMPVVVGGGLFRRQPSLGAATGATAVASSAQEAVERIRQLVPC